MPHFSGNQTFERLRQPSEVGMSVGNAEHRHVHRHDSTFRQRHNLNRQIAETVECFDFLNLVSILTEGCIHNSSVLAHNLIERLVEKFIVEIVDKVGFNETLQTEHYDLIPSLNSAHSGSEVRHGLRYVLAPSMTGISLICCKRFSINALVFSSTSFSDKNVSIEEIIAFTSSPLIVPTPPG